MLDKAEADAIRTKGTHNGYGYAGPIRVKYSEGVFNYFVNHIHVNKEYAVWLATHFQQT